MSEEKGPSFSIETYLSSLTPEQKKEHYEKVREKMLETRKRKKEEMQAMKDKAKELVPYLLAEEMIAAQDEKGRPPARVLAKLKELMDKGMSIERMRKELFPEASERSWNNLKRYLFQEHVYQAEDLGLEILNVKRRALSQLKSRIRKINKAIKSWEKEQADNKRLNKRVYHIPMGLFEMKAEAEDKALEIEMDVAKTLYSVGAVGGKSKGSGAISVNFNIPRPPKSQDPVDSAKTIEAEVTIDGD